MSANSNRNYLLLTLAAVILVVSATVFSGLSAVAAVAGAALVTAVAALAIVWRAGTPDKPMRQVLYDMDPHDTPASARR
jgi:hypothetical protein